MAMTRKSAAKKSAAKKATAKKAAPKKTSAKKASARSAAKAAPRKTAAKKVAARKSATKNPAARKAAVKKAAAKKPAVKKTAAKKVAAKKSARKTPAAKKAAPKKVVAKKVAVKKAAAKKVAKPIATTLAIKTRFGCRQAGHAQARDRGSADSSHQPGRRCREDPGAARSQARARAARPELAGRQSRTARYPCCRIASADGGRDGWRRWRWPRAGAPAWRTEQAQGLIADTWLAGKRRRGKRRQLSTRSNTALYRGAVIPCGDGS